jgi:hypothetical protein
MRDLHARYQVGSIILAFAATVAMAACLALEPGCAAIRGACSTAVPYLTTAQSYEVDAQEAVDLLPADVRAEAQAALDIANDLIIAAEGACRAIDSTTTFADFVTVWITTVEPKMSAKPARVPRVVVRARGR